jgi:hypothetical protein
VVELLSQFTLIDQVGEADVFRAIDQRESDDCIGLVAIHRLTHQKLVKVGVDQRSDNRINLPLMVPNACGDIDHEALPSGWLGVLARTVGIHKGRGVEKKRLPEIPGSL